MGVETHTKARSVRVDDPLWEDAKQAAAANGCTVTDVVVAALERLVRDWRRRTEAPTTDPLTTVTLEFDLQRADVDPTLFLHQVAEAGAAREVLAVQDVVRLVGTPHAAMVEAVPFVLGFRTD